MTEPSPFPPTTPPPRLVSPGLYLVATPIGNLRDMTLRALDVLAAADLVLAEDTRVTGKLLSAYGLKARLERCDDHASARAAELAIERLREGAVVALVSDAGTPLVSDPGFVVARAVIAEGLPVHPIPGASSMLAALCIAGLPADRVTFAGFLPPKSGARRAALRRLLAEQARALRANDLDAIMRIDMAFHRELRSLAGNRRLAALLQTLQDQVRMVFATSITIPGRRQRAVAEHRKILAAVEARDPRAAERAAREHIRRVREAVLAHLGAAGAPGRPR